MKPIDLTPSPLYRPPGSEAARPADAAAAAPPPPERPRSAGAAAEASPASTLSAGPQPVDAERVAQIREALRDGSYPLVPTKVSDAMIAAGFILIEGGGK